MHESNEHMVFVMQLVKAGSLESFMRYRRAKGQPISDAEASTIMRQILEGIAHIHLMNIIHRDLKPQNILLSSFRSLEDSVKIADFGLGTQLAEFESQGATEKCGTMTFASPELMYKQYYQKVCFLRITKCGIGGGSLGRGNHHVHAHRRHAPAVRGERLKDFLPREACLTQVRLPRHVHRVSSSHIIARGVDWRRTSFCTFAQLKSIAATTPKLPSFILGSPGSFSSLSVSP